MEQSGRDLDAPKKASATFGIVNGYLQGQVSGRGGANLLLVSMRESMPIGRQLGVHLQILVGTGTGDQGLPILNLPNGRSDHVDSGPGTLDRVCDLAKKEALILTLNTLNLREHPGCPLNSMADMLSLVAAVDRPQLRINPELYHTQIGRGDVICWV